MRKKSSTISRRVVLNALGASVALPWLESAKGFGVENAKVAPKRFAFLFFGDGIHPPDRPRNL